MLPFISLLDKFVHILVLERVILEIAILLQNKVVDSLLALRSLLEIIVVRCHVLIRCIIRAESAVAVHCLLWESQTRMRYWDRSSDMDKGCRGLLTLLRKFQSNMHRSVRPC